jgi:hypothetical protein
VSAWRYRRCPECRATFPGGQLKPLRYGVAWRKKGGGLRRCPECGHTGFTQDFKVVREQHHVSYAGMN